MPIVRVLLAVLLGIVPALADDASWPETLAAHGGPIKSVELRGREALTASFDYAANLWDLSGTEPRVVHRLIGHRAAVNDAAFAGSRAITASDDGSVMIWDLATGEAVARHETAGEKVMQVAVSPDAALGASAHWDGTARVFDMASGEETARLEGHTGNVNDITFADDGRIFTASYDGTVREWALGAERSVSRPLPRPHVNHGWGVNALRIVRRDGAPWLVFGALDGTVGATPLDAPGVPEVIHKATRPIMALATSPDGTRLAVGDGAGFARVVNVADWSERAVIGRAGPVWGIAFAGNDHLYLAGLDDRAFLWRAEPNAPLATMPETFPHRFQARPDGLALGGNSQLARGELQFRRKCSVCHTLGPDDANRAGPTLHALFGRQAASLPDYPYSGAMRGMDIEWNAETIGLLFEQGPDNYTPGSKMPMQRIVNDAERAALIAFLERATR